HNGMIRVDGRKMSKSLGNFFTVADVREDLPGEVVRLILLSAQYRQELDWTDKLAADAEKTLRRWRRAASGAAPTEPDPAVLEALADDLNTPKAIAELHRLAQDGDAGALVASANLLGLLTPELAGWDAAPEAEDAAAALIDRILTARTEARKTKDFARADALRAALDAAGVIVMDNPGGADWRLGPDFDPAKLEDVQ
ncbi:MAG: DALR domain-containing protein, partial [Pseudomonadota bacterium]